ncbi:hypothetical protein L596_026473 [Steinernema carpocapsae]|uniref:Uncharacterized protein n=1 Tax=Steinernema carpocapsae TaxID=34508 RepID=A0A4U5M1H6_STECR|nr:hypothetical protein L596_026473 [Steinernema carpocapsae]
MEVCWANTDLGFMRVSTLQKPTNQNLTGWLCIRMYPALLITKRTHGLRSTLRHINAAGKNSYYSWIACGVDAVEPVDP